MRPLGSFISFSSGLPIASYSPTSLTTCETPAKSRGENCLGHERQPVQNDLQLRCCLLVYRESGTHSDPPQSEGILLAVKDQNRLMLFLHRALNEYVSSLEDRKYMEDLIPDILERARTEPDAVFLQLNQLCSGPLVARDVELQGHSIDALQRQFPQLRPLL